MKDITNIKPPQEVDVLWEKHLAQCGKTLTPEQLRVSNGILNYLQYLRWSECQHTAPRSSAKFMPIHWQEFLEDKEAVNAWLNK